MRAVLDDLQVPMTAPFAHAHAKRSIARNLLLRIDFAGHSGVGECVPREYVTGESPQSAWEALTRLDLRVLEAPLSAASLADGCEKLEQLALPARLEQGGRPGLAAACAVELAALDLLCRRFGLPMRAVAQTVLPAALLRPPKESQPISRVLDFEADFDRTLEGGALPRNIKVKVGGPLEEDLARLKAARARAGRAVILSVDANMAWSLEEAIARVEAFAAFEIAWYEEPLKPRQLDDCRALRQRTKAKVMLDESLCSWDDALQAIKASACDLFNIRLSKCGGFIASLRLVELAHRHGLSFQLGAQVGELAVLAAAGRHFVCAVQDAKAYEGAAIESRFSEQLVAERLPIDLSNQSVTAPEGDGLGVTPIAERIDRYCLHRSSFENGSWQAQR